MSLPTTSEESPGSDEDYAAIEAAVMETARGRWFLAEYARRNRTADTNLLLAEIRRLESKFLDTRAAAPVDAETSPEALAEVIAEARREMAEDGTRATRRPFASFVADSRAELSRMEGAAERLHALAGDLRAGNGEARIASELAAQAGIVASASRAENAALGKLASIARALEEMERRLSPAQRAAPELGPLPGPTETRPAVPRTTPVEHPTGMAPAAEPPAPVRIDFDRLGFEQKLALFS